MQMIPQGGAFALPPWGILAYSRNREIRNSSDRLVWIFWIFWKTVQNQKSDKPGQVGEPGGAGLGEPGDAAKWTQHINNESKNPKS